LNVAGGGTDRVTFSDQAIDAIFNSTKGNPRLINLACDKALHHGHLARTFTIGPDIVNRSLAELGMNEMTVAAAPAAAVVSVPPQELDDSEATDDFGLGDKFFDRQKSEIADPPLPVEVSDAQLMFGGQNQAPAPRRRTVLLIAACVLIPAIVAWVLWMWQHQSTADAAPAPSQPPPVMAANQEPVEPAKLPMADAPISTESDPQPFEVGVALFSGYDRASRLAVSLAASGFRATTRMIESPQGRMYEVRTGPYISRDAAEADAAVIRKIPGYGDARVVPPPSTP
jgi:cell division septation protein DedD